MYSSMSRRPSQVDRSSTVLCVRVQWIRFRARSSHRHSHRIALLLQSCAFLTTREKEFDHAKCMQTNEAVWSRSLFFLRAREESVHSLLATYSVTDRSRATVHERADAADSLTPALEFSPAPDSFNTPDVRLWWRRQEASGDPRGPDDLELL